MEQKRRATLLSLAALGLSLLTVLGGGSWWFLVRQRLSEELRTALRQDDYAAVRTLVRRGAGVNTTDDPDYGDVGITPLELAVSHQDVAFARKLLVRGADADPMTIEGITPLLTAASWGPTAIIPDLLREGADPNVNHNQGFTPLMGAAKRGDAEAVRLLLQSGARVEATDQRGYTALAYAKPNVASLLRAAASPPSAKPAAHP